MFWKKTVAGYPVTLLFVLTCALCTFIYAGDQFVYSASLQTVYAAVYTVAVFACCIVLARLFRQLAAKGVIRISDKASMTIGIIVLIAGGVYLIVRAATAQSTPNALYRMMETDYLETPTNISTRTKLYLTLLSQLFSHIGISIRSVLVSQAILYMVAVVMFYFAVTELSGRCAAILSAFAMCFFPQFLSVVTQVGDEVFFWLMCGAGFLAGSLYSAYVADPLQEYPFAMKALIAAFTGIFLGVIAGWDGGLIILASLPLCAFFIRGARPGREVPYYLIHLAAFAGGFYLCAHDVLPWIMQYFASVAPVMPLPLATYPLFMMVLCSLAFFGACAFFADKKYEKVTPWMLIVIYALLVGSQVTDSGVVMPSFPILMITALFGTSLRELLRQRPVKDLFVKAQEKTEDDIPLEEQDNIDDIAGQIVADYERALKNRDRAAAEKAAAEKAAADAVQAEETMSAATDALQADDAMTAAAEEAAPAVTAQEGVPPELPDEETVEEVVEEITEEVVEEVEEAVEAAAQDAGTEAEPAEAAAEEAEAEVESGETYVSEDGEELHVPEGMVLPLGDETADDESSLHIRFDDLPGTYSIGLHQNEDKEVTEEVADEVTEDVTEEIAEDAAELMQEAAETTEEIEDTAAELTEMTEEALEEAASAAAKVVSPDMSDFDLPFIDGDDFDI